MTYATLNNLLGLTIDEALLELALTHSSYAFENGKQPDNERLEFLGDSVLGFLVTEHVYQTHPDLDEGQLSRLRNASVSAKALTVAANQLGLGKFIRLGKGELATGGQEKANILADCMEAIIGAAFISSGLDAAKAIVNKFIIPIISADDVFLETSEPRTVLFELLKKLGKADAVFEVAHVGPDHDRTFFAEILVSGEQISKGEGRTRKQAEANAAIAALKALRG